MEEERKDQELLHEVKKKEREATGTVRSLEADLQKESACGCDLGEKFG